MLSTRKSLKVRNSEPSGCAPDLENVFLFFILIGWSFLKWFFSLHFNDFNWEIWVHDFFLVWKIGFLFRTNFLVFPKLDILEYFWFAFFVILFCFLLNLINLPNFIKSKILFSWLSSILCSKCLECFCNREVFFNTFLSPPLIFFLSFILMWGLVVAPRWLVNIPELFLTLISLLSLITGKCSKCNKVEEIPSKANNSSHGGKLAMIIWNKGVTCTNVRIQLSKILGGKYDVKSVGRSDQPTVQVIVGI